MNRYQIMLREDIERMNNDGKSNAAIGRRVGLSGQRVGQILKEIQLQENVDAIAIGGVGGPIQFDSPDVLGYHKRNIGFNNDEVILTTRQMHLLDMLFQNQHIANYTYQVNHELTRDNIETIKHAIKQVHQEPMILAWHREQKRKRAIAERQKYAATHHGYLALLALENKMPEIATFLHRYAVLELNNRNVTKRMTKRRLLRLSKSPAQQLLFIKQIGDK